MTTENNSGTPSPENEQQIPPIAGAEQTPAPSPEDARIEAISAKVTELDAAIDAAETGRQRRDLIAQRDALTNEKARLQIRDILEAPERAGEPEPAGNEIAPYELVPPQYQAIAEAYREDAAAIAKDAGIPAGEMEVMLHLAMGGALEAVTQDKAGALSTGQIPGVDLSNRNACMGYLTHKYGDQAPIIVREAQAAFAKLPKSVQAYLDYDGGTGELLTNSPHLLLALAARNLGWTGLWRESAEKELAKLQGSKKLSAFDLDKRRILGHIVSRAKNAGTAKPAPKAAPSAPSVKAGVEKRMAEIRRDPNYHSKDNPSLHRALVAEMGELYAKRGEGR